MACNALFVSSSALNLDMIWSIIPWDFLISSDAFLLKVDFFLFWRFRRLRLLLSDASLGGSFLWTSWLCCDVDVMAGLDDWLGALDISP